MALAGTAFVNFQGDFKSLTSQSAAAGVKSGGLFSSSFVKGLAGMAVAGAAVGVGLYKIGEKFQESYDKIRIGTGATGKQLKGLEKDFKSVVQAVPTSFGDASTAIADLNTRLGITGEPLRDMSKQFLELSRITKTDVASNIHNLTKVFGDWQIPASKMPETLDKVYRAAQASGIGLGDLSTSVVQFGAPLRNLGFDFDSSLALLAQFDKAGVNTSTVFAGLKAGVGNLAKAGEPVPETFKRIVGQIQEMGPGTEATGLAIKLFGTRAGPDLADAIAGGKFAVGDMLKAITGGSDTIMKGGEDATAFGEKWKMLVNKVLVFLEPVAMAVFDAMSAAISKLPVVFAAIGRVAGPVFKGIAGGVKAFVAAFKAGGDDITSSGFAGFLEGLGLKARALFDLFKRNWPQIKSVVIDVFQRIKDVAVDVFDGIKAAVGSVVNWFKQNWPQIKTTVVGVFDGIKTAIVGVVDGFGRVVDAVTPVVSALAGFVKDNPAPVLAAIGAVVLAVVIPAFLSWAAGAAAAAVSMAALAVSTVVAAAPFIAIGAAIALVAGGVVYAYQHFETFRTVVDAVWQGIQAATSVAVALIVGLFNNVIVPAVGVLVNIFKGVLWPVIQAVWAGIQTAISVAWSVIKGIFDAVSWTISNVLVPIFNAFQAVAKVVWGIVWAVIQDAWEIVSPIFGFLGQVIGTVLVGTFNVLKDVAVVVWKAVSGAVGAAWDKVEPIFSAIVGFIKKTLAPVWETVSDAVSSAFEKIPGVIKTALRIAGNVVAGFMRGVASIADFIGLDHIAGALRSGAASADRWGEGPQAAHDPHARPRPRPAHDPHAMASGGVVPFVTNGPRAIVGEGNQRYPEYVIPTDPRYRNRARGLLMEAAPRLLAGGGIVGNVISHIPGAGIVSDVIDKARGIVAGSLEAIWPKMSEPSGLLGLPAGTMNHFRSDLIDLIRGHAQTQVAAADSATGHARGGVLPVSVHARSFDRGGVLAPGWNHVRNDTGSPEPLAPGRDAPFIGEANFYEGVDVDLVLAKASHRIAAGAL